MDVLRGVLLRVKQGETRFMPEDDSSEALKEFQPVAQALLHARDKNFIVSVSAREPGKGISNYGLIPIVMVSGGLTYEGERYLAAAHAALFRWLAKHSGDIVKALIVALIAGAIAAYFRTG